MKTQKSIDIIIKLSNIRRGVEKILLSWEQLDPKLQNEEVKKYYKILEKRKLSLIFKRLFDIIVSFVLILCLLPVLAILYIIIKLDSPGNVIFVQNRVTRNNKIFKIYKFRSMVENAEKLGSSVAVVNDKRITRVGKFMRKLRLDEIPQLFNILKGDLSFVGTRPEIPKYVNLYTPEMYATLLLPAGVTSLASILYKNESELLNKSSNIDDTYINKILPEKMKYNLEYIKKVSFWYDIKMIIKTVVEVIKK